MYLRHLSVGLSVVCYARLSISSQAFRSAVQEVNEVGQECLHVAKQMLGSFLPNLHRCECACTCLSMCVCVCMHACVNTWLQGDCTIWTEKSFVRVILRQLQIWPRKRKDTHFTFWIFQFSWFMFAAGCTKHLRDQVLHI